MEYLYVLERTVSEYVEGLYVAQSQGLVNMETLESHKIWGISWLDKGLLVS
jgi:hypothetical protein